jgi:hypothetical protein
VLRKWLMIIKAVGTVLALAVPAELHAQRNCTRGKPCGNSCIAQHLTCRIGTGTARPAAARPDNTPNAPSADAPRALLGAGVVGGAAAGTDLLSQRAGSSCTTNLASIREILIVSGDRGATPIGVDLSTGAPVIAPKQGDTVRASLLAILCRRESDAELVLDYMGRRVLLDALNVPGRTLTTQGLWRGTIRVPTPSGPQPAYVWRDELGTATLRAVP